MAGLPFESSDHHRIDAGSTGVAPRSHRRSSRLRLLSRLAAAAAGVSLVGALMSQPVLAVHAAFDNNPFTSGSDVVTGFSAASHTICSVGTPVNPDIGPVGLVNDGTNFFVDDYCNQTTYKLPASGGSITSPIAQLKNGLTGGLTLAGGVYYGLIQNKQAPAAPPGGGNAGLYTLDPSTLAVSYVVSLPGDSLRTGTYDRDLVADASGKNLYVSTSDGIYKVTLPGHVVTRFDKCPTSSPPCSGNFDGLMFSNDGSILYAADPEVNSNVIEFDASGKPTNATRILAGSKQGPDGLVVAPPGSAPNGMNVAGNLFINTQDGHVQRYTGPGHVSESASGGTRGDLATTDPKGCVYVDQTASVEKLLPCLITKKPPACVLHSNPSMVEMGLGQSDVNTSSSIADVLQVECQPIYSESTVTIDATQLNNACQGTLSWSAPSPVSFTSGAQFTVTLDDDGNATAALWGGPSCAASTYQIRATLNAPPFPTVKTTFTVLPPQNTKTGVTANPASEVEDSTSSSVATVIEVEFPSVQAEQQVIVKSQELYSRCAGNLTWVGPDEMTQGSGTPETNVTLDDNGNAFVVALAGPSCASGTSTVTADLTSAPYTSLTTRFTILSPRPTV